MNKKRKKKITKKELDKIAEEVEQEERELEEYTTLSNRDYDDYDDDYISDDLEDDFNHDYERPDDDIDYTPHEEEHKDSNMKKWKCKVHWKGECGCGDFYSEITVEAESIYSAIRKAEEEYNSNYNWCEVNGVELIDDSNVYQNW